MSSPGLGAGVWVASACCWASLAPAGARWLRVAQREHYLSGSVTRFAFRWWVGVPLNLPLLVVALLGAGGSWAVPLLAVATAAVAVAGPVGLSVRGRTSPLGLTRRLWTLAALWLVIDTGVVVVGFALHRAAFFSALAVLLAPALVDLACLVVVPLERHLASRYVGEATARIRAVHPQIVGITGSYGKTSTKNYVAHMLGDRMRVVASPASFNNRAGLARAVNEHLVDGTEVFVAEMGTYGRGEIAELCRWCPPAVAVITAIGPVHLERFGTEDEILAAKSEICSTAHTVVLNVDDHRLVRLADQLDESISSLDVVRCSGADRSADVCVIEDAGKCEVIVGGTSIAMGVLLVGGAQPTNVACAIAVAVRLGVSSEAVAGRLHDLPTVPHRLAVATAPSGVIVIDDTYNSNPAGALAALRVLAEASEGRRVVVTPGMVELGSRQVAENRAFARASCEVATDLVVVGRTNRAALVPPAGEAPATIVRAREDAVRWVRANLSVGDAVLYENDLPDHYP